MDKYDQLIKAIIDFERARGWENSRHEDLAKSVVIEAAELLEHFQWHTNKVLDESKVNEVSFEAADILIYLIAFCDKLEIDLFDTVNRKLKFLEEKYPVDLIKDKGEKAYYDQKKKYRQ